MHATGWSRGLEVTGGGTGVVSHAGLALLRQLSDRTGLTSGLSAALPSPLGGHDRGRVFADLACAIADGARVISDFRVMGDQRELFGPVASVPTAWRALKEIAAGGDRRRRKVTAAVNTARRHAWAQGIAPARRAAAGPGRGPEAGGRDLHPAGRHRRDRAHDKELAEANFKGYGHHPSLATCDNVAEPLAWMLRPGSAARTPRPITYASRTRRSRRCRRRCARKLMITCDGPAPATPCSRSWTGSPPGTATRSSTRSAGSWAPGEGRDRHGPRDRLGDRHRRRGRGPRAPRR